MRSRLSFRRPLLVHNRLPLLDVAGETPHFRTRRASEELVTIVSLCRQASRFPTSGAWSRASGQMGRCITLDQVVVKQSPSAREESLLRGRAIAAPVLGTRVARAVAVVVARDPRARRGGPSQRSSAVRPIEPQRTRSGNPRTQARRGVVGPQRQNRLGSALVVEDLLTKGGSTRRLRRPFYSEPRRWASR